MASVWRSLKGVSISEIGSSTFLFQFFHNVDIHSVLKGGPLFTVPFKRVKTPVSYTHLTLPTNVDIHSVLKGGPLFTVPFWVQIHNLPLGFMSYGVGQNIAKFLGQFLDYDDKNNPNLWRPFMSVKMKS